jgi:hypothetical protein
MRDSTLPLGLSSFLCIIACLLATPCASLAQSGQASWNTLSSLRAGQKIEVVETGLKKHAGTFMTVSDEAIQLREGTVEQAVRKENVLRVTLLEKGHRLRNALIFGAAGAGTGAVIGVAAGGSCHHSYLVTCSAAKRAAFGGVSGLVVGFPVGAAFPSHDTIYRANPH